jgi:DNA-binding transcriptional MerR regulator
LAKSPDAFRTISEVAAQLETPAHVLRFWESKFPQHIKPVKRAGGRRYYRPDDIALVAGIKLLLHDQGMTIRGVEKLLREKGARYVATLSSLPWEGTDAAGEDAEAPEPMAAAGPQELTDGDVPEPGDLADPMDGAPADPVVVGPWPGAGSDAVTPPSAEPPLPAPATVVGTFVGGVAARIAAHRAVPEAGAERSLAALGTALRAADRASLRAEATRLRPHVDRLRALRDGSPGRAG